MNEYEALGRAILKALPELPVKGLSVQEAGTLFDDIEVTISGECDVNCRCCKYRNWPAKCFRLVPGSGGPEYRVLVITDD